MINNTIDIIALIRIAGRNIEALRNIKKKSVESLAQELGLTKEELIGIEEGTVEDLSLKKLSEIANYFNCTLQQLLDLQIVQILNHSQYIAGGDREVKYTQELKGGYDEYIKHLKEEIHELKRTKSER
ncbi:MULTISPECIES: helix-turn-helix domain-containing protein [Sphingobacterium]|uniref:helix-turn-helix domain-containing protein n=1 Tax=Sphingobacterium TaxID=28453 RepID=UPI00104575E2|nr:MULTISPECIES: helix-turn-helix transcriptional regulator [Sphingobacterium]MCW2260326.1 transcriptional regulator with XRE-family HTH domain [Sphingobacterium kitahiroshimense]TCR05402.1 helix-turn-helix protein [Sphingobacterium sp. JUb78]